MFVQFTKSKSSHILESITTLINNIEVIRNFYCKSLYLNNAKFNEIHYFCNIRRNNHHQNGNDERYKSHKSSTR